MIAIENPYTGEVLGELGLHDGQAIEAMLARGFHAVGTRGEGERQRILRQVAEQVGKERDAFARRIAEEGGKPLADAQVEVERAIDGLRLAAELVEDVFARETVPMERTKAAQGHSAYMFREPVGLVVAISAFNHPLNLIVHQVAPAIALGCPVIVKPSLSTPYSCLALVRCFHEAGVGEDMLQVALCADAEAERLACDPRVGYLSFIGSAKVGWHLRAHVSPGVRVGLEHGGIAPVILGEGAGEDDWLEPVVKGGMYHAGQVCVSTQRVFVPRARMNQVQEKLAAMIAALRVGDPLLLETEVGPLIRPKEVERVGRIVGEALEAGATLVCGGKALSLRCYAPTLVADVPLTSRIMQEELFGPVIVVHAYDTLDEAIGWANHPRWGFHASLFSHDRNEIAMAVARLDYSGVMINTSTAFRTDWMPFGGRRHSGLGVGGIGYTMQEYTQYKLVVEKDSR